MNFVKLALFGGGAVKPLLVNVQDMTGPSLMNPSVVVVGGRILVNIRNVNYTLYHSELNRFEHMWGPLSYIHPENDLHLRTTNFVAWLDDSLDITRYSKVDTSRFDTYQPLWEFVGLEDVRLVSWEGKLYGIGVRRDVDTIGTGRMELSEFSLGEEKVIEVSRYRIPGPSPDNEYCMKNCTPVEGKPFHLLKWTNPTCLMKFDPYGGETQTFETCESIPGMKDMRGGSQVIEYGGGYLSVVHETELYSSEQGRKDATYRHRLVFWDRKFKLQKFSKIFSYLDMKIEFCAGLAKYGDDLLMTFGVQDNAAYILRVPAKIIDDLLS